MMPFASVSTNDDAPLPGEDVPRLDSADKEDMRAISKQFRPDWSDEDFEESWAEFERLKQLHAAH